MTEILELERDLDMGSKWHSFLQIRIANLLFKYYGDQFELYSELSIDIQDKEYKPDLAIYAVDTLATSEFVGDNDETKVSIMPICAIEIISPTQTIFELKSKIQFYLENGIKSAWLIVPDLRIISVFNLNGYETFNINSKLIDPNLNIELNLIDLFKRKL